MGNVLATVKTVDSLDDPIQGVLVQIYSTSGLYLTQGITSSLGEVQFTLSGTVGGTEYWAVLGKDEWSFLPNNKKSILITDPPNPDNDFQFDGTYGSSVYPVTFQVFDDTVQENPVDDVTIRIFDEDDVFITELKTGEDVAGEANYALAGAPSPGQDYIVRLYKTGVTLEHPTQIIQVIEDNGSPYGEEGYGEEGYGGSGLYPVNTFEFQCHVAELPEATNQYMCRLSGTLRDASLIPIKNSIIEFTMISVFPDMTVSGLHFINDPTVVDNHVIAKPVKVKSNVNGYVEIDLIRNAEYEAFIHGWQHPDGISESIIVPDAPGAKIEDVLFPYVSRVDFDSSAVSLLVGETKELGATATASNTQEISVYGDLIALLQFNSSDETIVRVAQGVGKTFVLEGIAAGTVTINVTRKDYTNAPRRPDIPDLLISSLTITVS